MKKALLILAAIVTMTAVSCRKDEPDPQPVQNFKRVFVMLSVGFNDLSVSLLEDQRDLIGEAPNMNLPLKNSGDAALDDYYKGLA